jgi:hypothetical protein
MAQYQAENIMTKYRSLLMPPDHPLESTPPVGHSLLRSFGYPRLFIVSCIMTLETRVGRENDNISYAESYWHPSSREIYNTGC